MQTEGIFVFKGIEKRNAFSFTNPKGKLVNVPASYRVRFDEERNGVIYDREIGVTEREENSALIGKLKDLKAYSSCLMSFEVNFYKKDISVSLSDISVIDENFIN